MGYGRSLVIQGFFLPKSEVITAIPMLTRLAADKGARKYNELFNDGATKWITIV